MRLPGPSSDYRWGGIERHGSGADSGGPFDFVDQMDPKHRRVQYDGNGHYIEDLGSVSGTKVNGKGVDRGPLAAGATIKLGNTEIGLNNAPIWQASETSYTNSVYKQPDLALGS